VVADPIKAPGDEQSFRPAADNADISTMKPSSSRMMPR
jgi:hypothetical protein